MEKNDFIEKKLLRYFDNAMEESAKEFGYTLKTLRPNCNWDISQIDPVKLYEYGSLMFLKGALAMIKSANNGEKEGIEKFLKNYSP